MRLLHLVQTQGIRPELRALRWHLPEHQRLDVCVAWLHAGVSTIRSVFELSACNFDCTLGNVRQPQVKKTAVYFTSFVSIQFLASSQINLFNLFKFVTSARDLAVDKYPNQHDLVADRG